MLVVSTVNGQTSDATALAPVATDADPIERLTLSGQLLPGDSKESLRRFLDIRLPGRWDDASQGRFKHDLDALGYQATFALVGTELQVALMPLRTVRRVYISGNWPIFAWEIQSYMTWRPGYRLPEGVPLAAEIRKQEQELESFLQRKGYYGASARLLLDWAPDSPQQVDVRVTIDLHVGFFRLRYKIGDIQAEGFNHLGRGQLAGFFEHCCLWLGRTSTELLNEDFKRVIDYYQSKGYVGVRLVKREIKPDHQRRQVDLDLAIEERRRIILHFVGRKKVGEKELLKPDVVTIFRDNYASANELDESARNIFRFYQQQGFFDAKVSWRWRDRSGDPMHVEFLIHEGPQLMVREIEFAAQPGGRPLAFAAAKLSDQILTRRFPRLGLFGLGEGGYVSAVQLEQDSKRLEDFYHRQGYPQARVAVEVGRSMAALDSLPLLGLETAGDASPDDSDLFIRFRIAEGRHEEVASVDISFIGQPSQGEATALAQVRGVLALKPGKPYTPETVELDKQRLGELFRSAGHPYAIIDPTSSTWSPDHQRVSLRWVIDAREPVTFGEILIRGNYVTSEQVIRRDLPFHRGDPYDRNKLLEAQQNLIGRQIFTSVQVIPNPGESEEFQLEARQKHWSLRRNPVPVLVDVTERYDSTGEVGVYVGVSTDNPIYGTAAYNWRNMAGTGAELELRGELGVRVQSLLFRLAQPRLFSPFLRVDFRGFWRNDNTYSVGLVNSYGANAELTRFFAPVDEQGRRLPPTLRLFGRLEFNFSQILVPLYRPEGAPDLTVDGDRTQALKLSFGVVWDRRVGFEAPAFRQRNLPVPPNPLMPVAGYLLSAQITGSLCCAFSPFNADGSFLAFTTQAVLLQPFGPELRREEGWPLGMRRFNFKLNLRVNYGIPFVRSALPVVERYFAGGDNSTRGYDTDALKAEVVRSPVGALSGDLGYRLIPQGGSVRILSQIEWEFAITPKLFNWPWVGALFVDTGVVSDGWQRMRWSDVRFSVGVSLLRLLTQFGALSLDYAYPLTLPGQDPLLQSDRWKHESWYSHYPGRIHFNWGMPISL